MGSRPTGVYPHAPPGAQTVTSIGHSTVGLELSITVISKEQEVC